MIGTRKNRIAAWVREPKHYRPMLAALYAALFVMAFLRWVLFHDASEKAVASSPFGFLAWVGIAFVLVRAWPVEAGRSVKIAAIVFALLYALALIVASNLVYKDSSGFTSKGTYLGTLMMTPCLYVLFARAMLFFGGSERNLALADAAVRPFPYLNKRQFLVVWAIILVCWLPLLLITWPGAYNYDAIYQTAFLFRGGMPGAHHPVLHTLWLALPMQLSQNLVGSYAPGFLFYTITQMLAVSFIYAQVVRIASSWRIPRWSGFLCIVAFALFPGFVTWSVTSTKDVMFAALFCVCFAQLIDLFVINKDVAVHRKRRLVVFWLSLFLMFMFRNNGAYAFALFAIIVVLFYKGRRMQAIAFSMSLLLVYSLVTGPLYGLLGINKSGVQEMMSVPSVQLARVATKVKEDLTQEQMEFIETYVPKWRSYEVAIADPVKGTFNNDKFLSEPMAFLRGYIDIGLEHPLIFTDAALRLSLGFWAPWVYFDAQSSSGYTYLNQMSPLAPCWTYPSEGELKENYIVVDQDPLLPQVFFRAQRYLVDSHVDQWVPGLASLMQTGTWVWLMLFVAMLCILQRRWKLLAACSFVFCYWFTLLLGPVSLFRYSNAIFGCALVMIMVLAKWRAAVRDLDESSCSEESVVE